jgi:hypothetical protein
MQRFVFARQHSLLAHGVAVHVRVAAPLIATKPAPHATLVQTAVVAQH